MDDSLLQDGILAVSFFEQDAASTVNMMERAIVLMALKFIGSTKK